MISTEWIKIIALAVRLIVETQFGDSLFIRQEWKNTNEIFLSVDDSLPSLYLNLYSSTDSMEIAYLVFIPWQNLVEPYSGMSDQNPINYSLLTVTEYAIIYERFISSFLSTENKKLLNNFNVHLYKLLDKELNQTVINEQDGISIPNGLKLISLIEHKYYIEQNIAQPGSKAVRPSVYENVAPGKMILSRLIPDYGQVKTQWLLPLNSAGSSDTTVSTYPVINIFKEALLKCLSDIRSERNGIYNETVPLIEKDLIELPMFSDSLFTYYKDLLTRVLNIQELAVIDFTDIQFPFGDYQPKLTPDILSDMIPALAEKLQEVPPSELQNLPDLVQLFKTFRKLARKNRGRWIEGNIILGANPDEYIPSLDEAMLCEIGCNIQEIYLREDSQSIRKTLKTSKQNVRRIVFKKFSVIHYDVMGSGRFFYIGNIENVKFNLKRYTPADQ